MSRNTMLTVALAAAGIVLAASLISRQPTAQGQATGQSGRYQVVANDKAFILYDSDDSSKTWILTPADGDRKQAWMPVKRLDSDAAVNNWRLLQDARR